MTEDQFLALCLQQGYDEKILLRLQKALAFAKKILSEKKLPKRAQRKSFILLLKLKKCS